jgi:hypothetical protein
LFKPLEVCTDGSEFLVGFREALAVFELVASHALAAFHVIFGTFSAVVVEALEANSGRYPKSIFANCTPPIVFRALQTVAIVALLALVSTVESKALPALLALLLYSWTEQTILIAARQHS